MCGGENKEDGNLIVFLIKMAAVLLCIDIAAQKFGFPRRPLKVSSRCQSWRFIARKIQK